MTLGRNLVAAPEEDADRIHFLHIPPAVSQEPVEGWSIPLPFETFDCAAYPPEDIVVVVEHKTRWVAYPPPRRLALANNRP